MMSHSFISPVKHETIKIYPIWFIIIEVDYLVTFLLSRNLNLIQAAHIQHIS